MAIGLENTGLEMFDRFCAAGLFRALNKLVYIMNIQEEGEIHSISQICVFTEYSLHY